MAALGPRRRATAPTSTCCPASTLATVNLMSLCGLHRRLRGAIVGHLALFEMTSSIPNRRYATALRRLGFDDPAATDFFDEHVEADAVHEAVAAVDLAGGLARLEPALARDILWGASALVASRGAGRGGCWTPGRRTAPPSSARSARPPRPDLRSLSSHSEIKATTSAWCRVRITHVAAPRDLIPREAKHAPARQDERDVAGSIVVQRRRRAVPRVRIRLHHEPPPRPTEIPHLSLNDGVDVRSRQTVLITQLVHDLFETAARVDGTGGVPGQHRIEGSGSWAGGTSREAARSPRGRAARRGRRCVPAGGRGPACREVQDRARRRRDGEPANVVTSPGARAAPGGVGCPPGIFGRLHRPSRESHRSAHV